MNEKRISLSVLYYSSFLIYLLVPLEARRPSSFLLFARFRNQATPLAHHHYRLTGTRRILLPDIFIYAYI